MNINPRFYMGYYDSNYPALDETTPWNNFLSYLECCKSLNQKSSVNRYVRYNNYFKEYSK